MCLQAQNVVPVRKVRPDAPAADEVRIAAVTQESVGSVFKLRGAAEIETVDMLLRADEIDYDEEKDYAEARGNVKFDYFIHGEHMEATRVEYHLTERVGKFYDVKGSTPAKLEARPGVLTTTSPFSFQGKWAERLQDRYILHNGFITNCKLPRPWWVFTGSAFDIIPGKRAITKSSFFKLRGIPIFYSPRFYKSLERVPRKSGFLTPSLTNSNRRGVTLGAGYYWAINRSYDAMYRSQWFTQRGFAHNVDFRGKPTQTTDFNYTLYGVNDKGRLNQDGTRNKPVSGVLMKLTGRSELPLGFRLRGEFNYLSSFEFRQEFTESFFEAIYSEVHSQGAIGKYWGPYALNIAASRIETFQWPSPESFPYAASGDNKLSLRKMPSFEFNSRDQEIVKGPVPVYVSWDANYSFLRRRERAFQTRDFVGRGDVEPRILTSLHWKDFHLVPSFSLRETQYNSSLDTDGRLTGQNFLRSSREFSADLVFPTLARIFEKPPKLLGKRLKHVIEPRATFRYVNGIGSDFQRLIRFDETELVSDTRELTVGVANRFYSKDAAGNVTEVFSWELQQRRYFDPTFGGAVVSGTRNVLLSTASLSDYAFLDVPRNYSPIVSTMRAQVGSVGLEWRSDYDPGRGRLVATSLSANGRILADYFVSVGHNQVNEEQVVSTGTRLSGLSPKANQLFSILGYGQENRRGVNAGFLMVYDYTRQVMLYNQAQMTYNTDCCGWSVQFRRFGFGNRNENQFRVAFNVANIGSFGTLRRQERMF
ncbi:MAG: LPS assembly protein LptD [Bryobacteraceae bacterium]|nr:LPS assembly protein LptD [Bryobacteraceae bacterium]